MTNDLDTKIFYVQENLEFETSYLKKSNGQILPLNNSTSHNNTTTQEDKALHNHSAHQIPKMQFGNGYREVPYLFLHQMPLQG